MRAASATTDPPGTVTLKSRTTGLPSRYSNSTSSNCSCASTGSDLLGSVFAEMPLPAAKR